MIYAGNAVQVDMHNSTFAKLIFDLVGESVNKLGKATLLELGEALDALEQVQGVEGLMVTSSKNTFIVGADINEFLGFFQETEEQLVEMNVGVNQLFNRIEDLPYPTVTLINGIAFGGGFEVCLATDYRIMAQTAAVALPEVKLGIMPGWGGSVRLPRLIGVDNAIEWICTGATKQASVALNDGAVDAVVADDMLLAAGEDLLTNATMGTFDYMAQRTRKQAPIGLSNIEQMMAFETAKGFVAAKAGLHYPAPTTAIKAIHKHAHMQRDKAQKVEAKAFAKLSHTDVAANLVGLFLADQYLKRTVKQYKPNAQSVTKAAVLGAGIMGGGIAYQSASKGIGIVMKDITDQALHLGMVEAATIMDKLIKRDRMDSAKMAKVLNSIRPTLSYHELIDVHVVVEAVVENPDVKAQVLAEVESHVGADAVIASNTSTISINRLAQSMKDPSRFCGMHFFNPVHRMPLVEIIRGEHTSDATISTIVAYADAMGKKPIVVNDCPGFYVNRVLFPYLGGFGLLLERGIDFLRIDVIMEKIGWPMGPAYLLDVIGIDTAYHCQDVMAEGFPDRMSGEGVKAVATLYEHQRLGQKNQRGFYLYNRDKKGRLEKQVDEAMVVQMASLTNQTDTLTDDEIIDYMMIPLCFEVARCLDENIVATPEEADLALIYGLGFPPFVGGACKYMDAQGLPELVARARKLAHVSPLYNVPTVIQTMADTNQRFYTNP